MIKYVVTCVLALVFGFGGAFAAVAVQKDSLRGPQGESGLTGPPGATGVTGDRGADGADGTNGKAGKAGKTAKPPKKVDPAPVNLGVQGCSGQAVQVVTDVTITAGQKIKLTKKDVCVVK